MKFHENSPLGFLSILYEGKSISSSICVLLIARDKFSSILASKIKSFNSETLYSLTIIGDCKYSVNFYSRIHNCKTLYMFVNHIWCGFDLAIIHVGESI